MLKYYSSIIRVLIDVYTCVIYTSIKIQTIFITCKSSVPLPSPSPTPRQPVF